MISIQRKVIKMNHRDRVVRNDPVKELGIMREIRENLY